LITNFILRGDGQFILAFFDSHEWICEEVSDVDGSLFISLLFFFLGFDHYSLHVVLQSLVAVIVELEVLDDVIFLRPLDDDDIEFEVAVIVEVQSQFCLFFLQSKEVLSDALDVYPNGDKTADRLTPLIEIILDISEYLISGDSHLLLYDLLAFDLYLFGLSSSVEAQPQS
jgi:hypothetical protein